MAANEPCQGHIYNPLLAASIAKRFFFPLCSDVLKLAKTDQTSNTQKKKKLPATPKSPQQTRPLKANYLCDSHLPSQTQLSSSYRKGPGQSPKMPLIFPKFFPRPCCLQAEQLQADQRDRGFCTQLPPPHSWSWDLAPKEEEGGDAGDRTEKAQQGSRIPLCSTPHPHIMMAVTTLSGEQELIKFTGIIEEEII